MNRLFTRFLLLVCIACKMVSFSSCANIIPPSGGVRDSLPPRLVFSTPKDSAVNVNLNTKTIVLTFDEYITLQNWATNLIISPVPRPEFPPQIDSKLRNITIKLREPLDSNTTYSFNFGDAIQDVNESNIARGLLYAFSTGKSLDQNTYRGKVLLAETGKPQPDSSLIVILHRNLADTAVAKVSPRYYAVLNGKGEFMFHNLPAGKFAVYAVSSRFTRKYTDSTEFFAFRSEPITIGAGTPRDTLYAYQEVKPVVVAPALTSTQKALAARTDDKRLKYSTDLETGLQDILGNLTLTFNRKITKFDSTKVVLYDTSYRPLTGYTFSFDSTRTKLLVSYKWKENTPLRLVIAKDALADSAAITLTKADTIRLVTKKELDYGSIRLRFPTIDLTKNPVLQFVQNDKIIESVPLTTRDFQRKLFRPGSYDIRILYDANKNGVWDAGNFFHGRRQPEIVIAVPQQVSIRGNWDNDVRVAL